MSEENRGAVKSAVYTQFTDGDEKVLSGIEAFAKEAGLNEQGAQRFRLLAEELIGMTGVLLAPAKSSLWAEKDSGLSLICFFIGNALDIDLPASEFDSQSDILTFLADSK